MQSSRPYSVDCKCILPYDVCCLPLGFKDDLVCAPVSVLGNGSATPVWIWRQWDTGRPMLWQGQKQLCGDDHGLQAVIPVAPFPMMYLLCV